MLGQYITTVPAQQRLGRRWYTGSADAIFQSLNLVYDETPDYIVVFGADHVYRMDPSQMLAAHIESGAGVTVAGIRVPRAEAKAFGCIASDETGRITEFLEKPSEPPSVPDDPEVTFASMGNYIFTTDALLEALKADAEDGDSDHDMGGDIIPRLVGQGEAHVYDFAENDRARRHRPRRGLLARRRHDRRLLRGAHRPRVRAPDLQPLQPALAHPHGHGARCRPPSSWRAASRRTRSSARARSSPGRSCAGR